MCAESSVDFAIAFQGWKAGRRGGEGLRPGEITARARWSSPGNFIEFNPSKYGGNLQVDTGCVVAFEDSIRYGMERIGGLSAQTP